MEKSLLELLAAPRSVYVTVLGKKCELRLASAYETLTAKRKAARLGAELPELAPELVSNCCLLARCLRADGREIFDARELIERLDCGELDALCGEYERMCTPTVFDGEESIEELAARMKTADYERMKWRVLREFRVLPNEPRAREMTDSDYLYCFIQLRLDDEERLERLCPGCRARLEKDACPVCGEGRSAGFTNPSFDMDRFKKMKGDECADRSY